VSRTATAPFDRVKIFLITRSPELGGASLTPKLSFGGVKAIAGAIARIYAEGGVLAFWIGNGLSVVKILPESAIKFYSYESSVCYLQPLIGTFIDHCNRNAPLPSTGTRWTMQEILAEPADFCLEESAGSPVN
jgi:hypothetical protein